MSTQPNNDDDWLGGVPYPEVWEEALRRVAERDAAEAERKKKEQEAAFERKKKEEAAKKEAERQEAEDRELDRIWRVFAKRAREEKERKEKEEWQRKKIKLMREHANRLHFEKVTEEARVILEEERMKKKEEERREFESCFDSVFELARDMYR